MQLIPGASLDEIGGVWLGDKLQNFTVERETWLHALNELFVVFC